MEFSIQASEDALVILKDITGNLVMGSLCLRKSRAPLVSLLRPRHSYNVTTSR